MTLHELEVQYYFAPLKQYTHHYTSSRQLIIVAKMAISGHFDKTMVRSNGNLDKMTKNGHFRHFPKSCFSRTLSLFQSCFFFVCAKVNSIFQLLGALKFNPEIGHFWPFSLAIGFWKCPKLSISTTFQNPVCYPTAVLFVSLSFQENKCKLLVDSINANLAMIGLNFPSFWFGRR